MLWIIQENLYNENKRGELINALTRLDIPFISVMVHNNTITPEIPLDNTLPIITNGSIMLSNIALSRGWMPGSLINENFSYDVWSKHYEALLLNKNATMSTLKEAQFTDDKMFVRPILDNKTFNGRVFTKEEFLAFQEKSMTGDKNYAKPETEILLSKPKKIGQEHRHYIVDGEVITSSRYKFDGQPNFKEGCDEAVLAVVKKAIQMWTPSRAFVLDTYIAGDEIGIVEIGGICHAGLYESNVMKLVNALDSMPIDLDNKPATKPKYKF
jgi:hypothetical protein